jgi:aspartyl-tRNA(Asn)/glutamyl-tRNA(Gln) amidotransferase subunit A
MLTSGVREIAEAVAGGEITPIEVLEAVFARIEATEEKIQAWSYLDLEMARQQAEALTVEAKAGLLRGSLHGVPVAVKDEYHVKGMPTALRGENARIEPEDATVVRKLRESGAIIVGKTYMPVGGTNPPTRNPWHLEHTPGGSSSGSGAAVSARVVPVAVAEQSAGSALRPAAYCGVTAIKPSYGRISRFGCYPLAWSRDTVGLIGLDMADLALVLAAVAGPDPLDPTTLQEPAPPAELQLDGVRPPRLGILRSWFPERTEDYMNEAVEAASRQLGQAGAVIDDVSLPEDFDLLRHAVSLVSAEAVAMRADAGRSTDPLKTTGVEFVPATFFVQARRIRTWMMVRLRPMFSEYDGLISATAPGQAPRGLHTTGDPVLLDPWTFLGFPAITLNAGLSPDGLPLGLQIVGGPKADFQLLQTGAWCEQVLGLLPPPPLVSGVA